MITIEQVKKLRDKTGISIMQCKKALEEADGNMEKAKIILRKKSGIIADKKISRELKAGAVNAYIHNSGDIAAIVLLSSETDFVAKNEEFVKLAYDIAMHIAAMNPSFIKKEDITEDEINNAKEVFIKETKDKPKEMKEKILQGKIDSYFKDKILLEQPFIKDPNSTIKDIIKSATQKFGERIEVSTSQDFRSEDNI